MTEQKLPKLIVVMAFDPDEAGDLQTVFGPQDYQSEDRAVRQAKLLADQHAGVIAWSREANVDVGEYGEPITLFQAGDIPDME
ncbi:MAG: hypothetical protein IBJ07_10695 [Rhizobiaceae bacterium]|nr:hypothetical protein [Rhizobiaceae bacterium]